MNNEKPSVKKASKEDKEMNEIIEDLFEAETEMDDDNEDVLIGERKVKSKTPKK